MKQIITLLLLLSATLATAQTPTSELSTAPVPSVESPTPTLEELAAEVTELKARQTTWQRIVERLPRVSGFIQAGFEWNDPESSFTMRRVRLSLAGDISPKIDYRLQVDLTKPILLDAFIQYKPFRELNLRLGQFTIPFTIENYSFSPLSMQMIEYPLAVRRLAGFDDVVGLSSVGRDRGFSIFGGLIHREGFDMIKYEVAVFNGEGLGAWDNNRHKDIVANLSFLPIRGLALSGSIYEGEFGVDRILRRRYAGGGTFDRGRWIARGEWIGGNTGGVKSAGWYAEGGFRVRQNLTTALRYDTFTQNIDDPTTCQRNYTVGVSWTPYKYLRCQLNYIYEDIASPTVNSRNRIAMQLTGMF